MEITNKRLNAANSHFVAQRDRCVAELDVMLNNYTGLVSMDAIIDVFEKLAIANMAISNIKSIVQDNAVPEKSPEGLTLNQVEEMNRMVDAIRQKVSPYNPEDQNTNQSPDA